MHVLGVMSDFHTVSMQPVNYVVYSHSYSCICFNEPKDLKWVGFIYLPKLLGISKCSAKQDPRSDQECSLAR